MLNSSPISVATALAMPPPDDGQRRRQRPKQATSSNVPSVAQTIPMSKGADAVSVLAPRRYAFSRRSRPIPSRIRPEMRRAIGGMFRPNSAAVILSGGSGSKVHPTAGVVELGPEPAGLGVGHDAFGRVGDPVEPRVQGAPVDPGLGRPDARRGRGPAR